MDEATAADLPRGLTATLPSLEAPVQHLPTGNLSVHLEAHPTAPILTRMGVASLIHNGLLDLVGERLLQVMGSGWRMYKLSDWIPVWENSALRVTLLAPYGERGVALRIEPLKSGPIVVNGSLDYLGLRRIHEEQVAAFFHARQDAYSGSYVLEGRTEHTLLALGLQADPLPQKIAWGEAFGMEWDSGPVTVYMGLAPEGDGAATTALHLQRVGWETLLSRTQRKIEYLVSSYTGPLGDIYRRHLVFAYFFGQADTLEGQPILLTSRSAHYPLSGVYRATEGLLWLYPMLLRADLKRAKSILRAVFERYARWPGEHMQYLSGPPLFPGFKLSHAAAYPMALARYLETAGANPELVAQLREPLESIFDLVEQNKHPTLPLYRSFLSPSNDPVQHPYGTFDNGLWALALERLSPYWPQTETLKHQGRIVRETLYRQAERGGRYVLEAEPGEGFAFGDEPAGSLLTLPHLGFCSRQDAVWQATAMWALSEDNPQHHRGTFLGEGTPRIPFPSGMGLANRILSGLLRPAGDALMILEQAPLDHGYAPAFFDPQTGMARGGIGYASLAGLIAYALASAKENRSS